MIGIGGIGISAAAKYLFKSGKFVVGSDASRSETTDELEEMGIEVVIGHDQANLDEADLVIYSSAVPEDNPERVKAKELDIEQLSYSEFLGELSREKWTIAISGTNGKTTTTAMAGLILEADAFDPTVIVGSRVSAFDEGNLRIGQSEYFVVEACEYKANMLNIWPQMIVLTNIEEDHLDFYKDIAHIRKTFKEFLDHLPECGYLAYNSDDQICFELGQLAGERGTSYGIEKKADLMAKNIEIKHERQYFDLIYKGKDLGQFELQVPGRFNIYNALAAACASLVLGVEPEAIKRALKDFKGTWRRFEKVAEKNGITVISDYAHHPTAIQGTLKAAREFYPGRRIVAAFQPHQRNRTKNLFVDFAESFEDADVLILNEIFDVAGREENKDQDVSSKDIVNAIKKKNEIENRRQEVVFTENRDETKKKLNGLIKKGDVVLVMGAGDMYKIAKELI